MLINLLCKYIWHIPRMNPEMWHFYFRIEKNNCWLKIHSIRGFARCYSVCVRMDRDCNSKRTKMARSVTWRHLVTSPLLPSHRDSVRLFHLTDAGNGYTSMARVSNPVSSNRGKSTPPKTIHTFFRCENNVHTFLEQLIINYYNSNFCTSIGSIFIHG